MHIAGECFPSERTDACQSLGLIAAKGARATPPPVATKEHRKQGCPHEPCIHCTARLFTYSAIFGLGYAATLGLWFGLAGAFVMGPSMEYQLWRRARGVPPSNLEWAAMATLRGFAFGAAGWLAIGHHFGVAFGVLSAIAMHLSYESGFGTNAYRIYQRPRIERSIWQGGLVRGVMIGLAGIIAGAIAGRPGALLYGIQIGLVLGVLNTTVTILSPLVEWWADNLPDRALGGYGAFLLLIGSALQTVQYVTPLISR